MILGRTDLRIGVSGPKFDAESDFEVHLAIAHQKPGQNCKKLFFRSKLFADFYFPASKNKMSGIVSNALCQILTAVRAIFEG